jgi:membrane-associated phospholipid phosphatase
VQNTQVAAAPVTLTHGIARYLSVMGHPFIIIPASMGTVSILRGGETRTALGLAVTFVAVSVAIVLGIKAGRFNDFDVSERQRRPAFYVLLTGATVALGVWLRDDPGALRACTIAGAVLAACGLLNRWTKASLHTAFSLYAAGFWGAWSVSAGLLALPMAALVAWSRARLGRHSWSEIATGAAVGLVAACCLMLFSSNG